MSESMRMSPRSRFLSLAHVSFQQAIAYRWSTIMNIAVAFLWVFIIYFLWRAAFTEQQLIGGFTWEEMRSYVLLGYAINALVSWRTGADMMMVIRTGEIARELVRPMNYCTTRLALTSGSSVVDGMLSLVLAVPIGLLFIDMAPPDSALALGLFLISIMMGFVTKALIVFSVSLLAFWTLNGVGISWTQVALVQILSGAVVPISLMPDWLRIPAEFLPLRGIVSTPVLLYLGKIDGWARFWLMGLQAFWLVVLWLLANWAWRKAFNAADIQGG